jgi:hypothetical protein
MVDRPPPPPPPLAPPGGGRRPRRPASPGAAVAVHAAAASRVDLVSDLAASGADDVDGISVASSASDRHGGEPPERRQRSLSFDDLYSLAPLQVSCQRPRGRPLTHPAAAQPLMREQRHSSPDDVA